MDLTSNKATITKQKTKIMKRATKGIPTLLLAVVLNWAVLPQTGAGAAVINLNFRDAATATDDGPQDGVFDAFTPFNFGSVNNNGYTSLRTVLEFDVSALPPGSTVKSATLTMFVDFVEGTRSVALHGYA